MLYRALSINAYWLLGFIEGEGTFGFQNLRPSFSVGQNTISEGALDLIKSYIKNLPIINNLNTLSNKEQPYPVANVIKTLHVPTSMCILSISDVDVLYFIILPFFSSLSFVSRKFIDFQLWTLGLLLIKNGYVFTERGKDLLLKIKKNMNNKRYTNSSLERPITISQLEVDSVFSSLMPFDLTLNQTHHQNVRKLTGKKGGNQGCIVYAYDKDQLINNAPFLSYKAAKRYIQNISTSTISFYINTGKIYKDRYTFYSQPK